MIPFLVPTTLYHDLTPDRLVSYEVGFSVLESSRSFGMGNFLLPSKDTSGFHIFIYL